MKDFDHDRKLILLRNFTARIGAIEYVSSLAGRSQGFYYRLYTLVYRNYRQAAMDTEKLLKYQWERFIGQRERLDAPICIL